MFNKISFVLDIEPSKTTFQSNARILKRGKFSSFGMPEKCIGSEWKEALLQELYKHRIEQPIEDACHVLVVHQFQFLKGAKKDDRNKIQPVTTRPDLDNMNKIFQDCLARAGFVKDDSIIAHLEQYKQYWIEPCIYVCISPFVPFIVPKI